MPATSDGISSGVMDLRFDGRSYRITPSNAPTAAAPAGSTVLLDLPSLPFETLGLALPCRP